VPSGAADDGGAKSARFFQFVERAQQRLDQIAVVGVVALWAVKHDLRDAAFVDVEEDGRG
jgi:hypothetical protein